MLISESLAHLPADHADEKKQNGEDLHHVKTSTVNNMPLTLSMAADEQNSRAPLSYRACDGSAGLVNWIIWYNLTNSLPHAADAL